MSKQLSENFTLAEMTVTNTGAVNVPDEHQEYKLFLLCQFILQPIRNRFGSVQVNSAFRSEFVNDRIGGAKTSQHMKGEAADIVTEEPLENVFKWIRETLNYGQVILENKNGARWIHVSLPRLDGQNKQTMTYDGYIYREV